MHVRGDFNKELQFCKNLCLYWGHSQFKVINVKLSNIVDYEHLYRDTIYLPSWPFCTPRRSSHHACSDCEPRSQTGFLLNILLGAVFLRTIPVDHFFEIEELPEMTKWQLFFKKTFMMKSATEIEHLVVQIDAVPFYTIHLVNIITWGKPVTRCSRIKVTTYRSATPHHFCPRIKVTCGQFYARTEVTRSVFNFYARIEVTSSFLPLDGSDPVRVKVYDTL